MSVSPARAAQKLGTLAANYSALALPLRMLIGAVITLAAGAGLGFFAEYAAYSWALYYGIRPPLEGIPYLKVAVTSLAVGVLLGGALLFTGMYALCALVIDQVENSVSQFKMIEGILERTVPRLGAGRVTDRLIERFRAVRGIWMMPLALALPLAVTVSFALGGRSALSSVREIALAAFIGLFWFLLVLLAWKPSARPWVALTTVLFFVVIGPFLLFNVHAYGALLRGLGYGGGLPVTVALAEEKADLTQKTLIHGSLLLRTTSAILIYQRPEARIREIPIGQVIYVDHQAIPVADRKVVLPD